MKKILIFGATSEIAYCCANIWALGKNTLYLVARNNEELTKMTKDLKKIGCNNVYGHSVDLLDFESHPFLINDADKKLGGIDIVLLAHGTLPKQKTCEISVSKTLFEISNNALSSVSLLTLLGNYFEKRKKGVIAIISSVAGDRGRSSNYIYGSSKSLITTFVSGLRQRLSKYNITVLTIKPGFVDTKMTKSFKKGILWVKPDYVARKIIWAIDNKKNQIYTPFFWRIIIFFLNLIPESLFKKMNL